MSTGDPSAGVTSAGVTEVGVTEVGVTSAGVTSVGVTEVGVMAVVRARPGREVELEAALRRLVDYATTEPGTLLFALHADRDRAGSFVLFERYRDGDAWLRHRTSPAMERFKDELPTLVGERELTVLVPGATRVLPDLGNPDSGNPDSGNTDSTGGPR